MFEWDKSNSGHVKEHGLSTDDVEDALLDPRRLGAPAHDTFREQRRGVIGATSAGRVIFVVITRRGDALRVVTARDANKRETRRYHRRGK